MPNGFQRFLSGGISFRPRLDPFIVWKGNLGRMYGDSSRGLICGGAGAAISPQEAAAAASRGNFSRTGTHRWEFFAALKRWTLCVCVQKDLSKR